MYRYLLFTFDMYYPRGGMNDCKARFNKIEEIDFNNLDFDYQFVTLYDVETNSLSGLSLYEEVQEYEGEDGYLSFEEEEAYKLKLVKELITNKVEN